MDIVAQLKALLARCNPPGYIIEPAPRGCDDVYMWDSCEDDNDGYGFAEDEDAARRNAWEHFHMAEAERLAGDR